MKNAPLVSLIFLFFACGITLAVPYAYISDLQRQIAATNRKTTEQRDENSAINAKNMQGFNIAEIERRALEELHMNKPDPSQIIHIEVEKNTHVQTNGAKSKDEPNGWWDRFLSFFNIGGGD